MGGNIEEHESDVIFSMTVHGTNNTMHAHIFSYKHISGHVFNSV